MRSRLNYNTTDLEILHTRYQAYRKEHGLCLSSSSSPSGWNRKAQLVIIIIEIYIFFKILWLVCVNPLYRYPNNLLVNYLPIKFAAYLKRGIIHTTGNQQLHTGQPRGLHNPPWVWAPNRCKINRRSRHQSHRRLCTRRPLSPTCCFILLISCCHVKSLLSS